MALYGTYRPKNFSTVVGQEAIKTTLLHASAHNRVSHASLFCGTRGTGKTTSARIVAKALNCQNLLPSGDPCLECDFCVAAEEGRMTDIIEIDAASNRGIDEIRDLREKVNFSPNFGKAKIYIIDEVHMLTKEAFNALLKTLEEPPAHAYFILATTEFHKVPETIRSRCQTFFFRKISVQDIVERLEFICDQENIVCDRKGIEIIAEHANGGLRDAISLLEQSASYGEISEKNLHESLGMISEKIFEDFLETLSNGNSQKALSLLDSLQDEGRNLEEFGKDLLGVLRKTFHTFLHARDARLPWILQVVDIFETALQNCRSFDIPPLAFEMAVAKAMLLQKQFSESLTSSHISEEIIDNLIEEKNHIAEVVKEKTQNFVEKKTEKKPQKKIIPEKNNDITPPWEDQEVIQKEKKIAEEVLEIEQEEKILEKKLEKNIQENIQENIPENFQKSSPFDDNDMFPSSGAPEISPLKEGSQSSKKEKISGNFEENVKKHWNDILSLLPKSVATNIKKFGKFSGVSGDTVIITIEGNSTRKLLSTEKNIQKIQEVFSTKFEKNIHIEFTGDDDEGSSSLSRSPAQVPEKNISDQKEIEISEMEDLLKF